MFDPEHLNFHFPLFTTCFHMLVQFCLASAVLFFFPRFRPRYDSLTNPHNTHSDADRLQHEEESKKPLMSRMFYFTRIGPCGLATGLDIGLGNMSLKFITLTFYSSSPYFPPFYFLTNSPQQCANPPLWPSSSASPSLSA
jgi:solute carrier family 35 protein C2